MPSGDERFSDFDRAAFCATEEVLATQKAAAAARAVIRFMVAPVVCEWVRDCPVVSDSCGYMHRTALQQFAGCTSQIHVVTARQHVLTIARALQVSALQL